MTKYNVLLIEDETAIRDMVTYSLGRHFNVQSAGDVAAAEKSMRHTIPDLILLDWMLPDVAGIDYIKRLKRHDNTKQIPVIMLTAKAEEESKVKGLDYGADDYITKPFSPKELIARINAVLRRGPMVAVDGTIQFNELVIYLDQRTVRLRDETLAVSQSEFDLLYYLVRNKQRVLSRQQLLDNAWGTDTFIDDRAVDVKIRRLRKALKDYGAYIKTAHGVGYKFTDDKDA